MARPSATASHGTQARYMSGCRCVPCRAWRTRENDRQRRQRIGAPPHTVKNPSHGTERRYHRGCRCDPCRAAYDRKKARTRKWSRTEHGAAHVSAYDRRWRAANSDHVRAYAAAWRAQHPEKVRAYAAKWRAANPGKHRAPIARLTEVWPFTRSAGDLDPITATIQAAVPRNLPEHIRQEVCQDLAIELLTTGQITPATINAAVRTVKSRYPLIAGRHRSLDVPLPSRDGDSRTHWIDQLPDPACIAQLVAAGATYTHTR